MPLLPASLRLFLCFHCASVATIPGVFHVFFAAHPLFPDNFVAALLEVFLHSSTQPDTALNLQQALSKLLACEESPQLVLDPSPPPPSPMFSPNPWHVPQGTHNDLENQF